MAGNPDLFGREVAHPSGPRAVTSSRQRGGITDELAKMKNRAWPRFHFWLDVQTRETLDAAIPAALAKQYPPLDAGEIGQCIVIRRKYMK